MNSVVRDPKGLWMQAGWGKSWLSLQLVPKSGFFFLSLRDMTRALPRCGRL